MRRVLFICTGNCVRSQMAEALLNYRGRGRFEVASAGSNPAGFVHTHTLHVLNELGIKTKNLRSKSWDEFKGQPFDAVITLCGSARDVVCPLWDDPSAPAPLVRAHWGFDDPSARMLFNEERQLNEFRRVRDEIRRCVEHLALAPDTTLDSDPHFVALIERIASESPRP